MGTTRLRISRVGRVRAAAAAIICLAASVLTAGPASADVTSASGGAFGEQINVTPLGLANVTSGPVPAVSFTDPDDGPGPHAASLAGATVPPVTGTIANVGLMNVRTERTGNLGTHFAETTSSASVADVNLLAGRITAEAISSTCTATSEGVSGSTTLLNASALGFGPLAANPGPNTEVLIPGARIVLNEQIVDRSGQTNAITVNAVHVYLLEPLGSGDIIIAQSRCSVTGPDVVIPVGTIGGIGLAGLLGAIFVGMQVRRTRANRAGETLARA